MFDKLCLEEGQKVNLRALSLKPGTFIKLQPHKTAFIELPNPKAILEYSLRDYFCVTEGDTISIKFNNRIYKIDVIQCKPDKQIRTLNCDLVVDFDPPKDYKEPETKKEGINIKFKSEKREQKLTKEEIDKLITDSKFKGHFIRSDGKEVTQVIAKKINAKKEKVNNEEDNYDPRKCRINITPRLEFKYVEL
jgi:ubiquitin fusion degradation protein 1